MKIKTLVASSLFAIATSTSVLADGVVWSPDNTLKNATVTPLDTSNLTPGSVYTIQVDASGVPSFVEYIDDDSDLLNSVTNAQNAADAAQADINTHLNADNDLDATNELGGVSITSAGVFQFTKTGNQNAGPVDFVRQSEFDPLWNSLDPSAFSVDNDTDSTNELGGVTFGAGGIFQYTKDGNQNAGPVNLATQAELDAAIAGLPAETDIDLSVSGPNNSTLSWTGEDTGSFEDRYEETYVKSQNSCSAVIASRNGHTGVETFSERFLLANARTINLERGPETGITIVSPDPLISAPITESILEQVDNYWVITNPYPDCPVVVRLNWGANLNITLDRSSDTQSWATAAEIKVETNTRGFWSLGEVLSARTETTVSGEQRFKMNRGDQFTLAGGETRSIGVRVVFTNNNEVGEDVSIVRYALPYMQLQMKPYSGSNGI